MSTLAVLAVEFGWITTGILGFLLWLVLLIWLGLRTLRHGHWVMYLVGLVLPIFWVIGALIPRRG